jgi:hypothetical protein
MKEVKPDGKEFILGITEKALLEKMVQPNPLIVIDAISLDNEEIKREQYSILYKEDIETINVLDGVKAIPIYGDKGKNGLILVTRKTEKQKYLKHYLKWDKEKASR